jgi:radical SAM protein with 4Fe4S-binding SPASM domain
MSKLEYSVIFLPTLHCDARCDYCFEDKSIGQISPEHFEDFLDKLLDFADVRHISRLHLYWQGGEIFTLTPPWMEKAYRLIQEKSAARGCEIRNYLQTNLLAYDDRWNNIIATMFGNSAGTSMDFPNRHRRMPGGTPEEYTERWMRHVQHAMAADIRLGVIAVPSAETLQMGAEAFYDFFTRQVGVTDFQVNSPFPGGQSNEVKGDLPLDAHALGRFLIDLTDIWLERGYGQGILLGPSAELLNHFLGRENRLPCYWQDNCANGFSCVDPAGHVSQCDCWAASYPGMRYGNMLGEVPLATLLEKSAVRREFLDRPGYLVANSDCLECEHLGVCHGGCPVRAYSTYGSLLEKDPYCETYKMLFSHVKQIAAGIATRTGESKPSTMFTSSQEGKHDEMLRA